MRTWQIALSSFQLAKFIRAMNAFFAANQIPPAAVALFQDDDEPLSLGAADGRDLAAELMDGRKLYFPFSDTNTGEAVSCADGRRYRLPVAETDETELSFCAAEWESVGFLVAVSQGEVRLEKVALAGGELLPADDPEWLATDLAESMTRFIQTFIAE